MLDRLPIMPPIGVRVADRNTTSLALLMVFSIKVVVIISLRVALCVDPLRVLWFSPR
ncbi:MAG: hypothetical protein LC677_04260 [Halomonas sp.]|nr:hypothetical protein [Halomonas sp.]